MNWIRYQLPLVFHYMLLYTCTTVALTAKYAWQLEAMRAAREAQEEALALMQAQHTVQNLQQMEKIVQQSEKMVCHVCCSPQGMKSKCCSSACMLIAHADSHCYDHHHSCRHNGDLCTCQK